MVFAWNGQLSSRQEAPLYSTPLPQPPTATAKQEVTVMFNLVNEPWPKYNMQVGGAVYEV